MSLAVWFEKERRLDEAWEQVEACLAKYPKDDQARYFRAFLLHRQKKDAEAETALRDLIKDGPKLSLREICQPPFARESFWTNSEIIPKP
jgi:predicted Zn-dependent protease